MDFLKLKQFSRNNMSLYDLSIQEVTSGLKKRIFSCQELIKSSLKRIKQVESKINAFISVNNKALKLAEKYDYLIASSNKDIFEEKPLLGIPMAFKDLFTTKDLRTTAGSKIIDNYIPPFDATVVKRLKEAGVICLGKTNEDAWGHGSSGENSDFGPTKNPYNMDFVPGGSSSGSGAAVASGECLFATGTDTGSSVRLPAAFCNLVGLKPTYGRVSRYGIIAMASSFDSIGHLTRTVYDNARVLEITAGKDPYDSTTFSKRVPKYTSFLGKDIKGLKIGIPKEYFVSGIDNQIKKVTFSAIKKLEKLGAVIKNVSLPYTQYAMACYYILVPSEVSSNLARFDGIRYGHNREVFGDEAKRRMMLGAYTLSAGYYEAYYLKAARVRTLIKRDFEEAFKKTDVLLLPSSPSLPFKVGEKDDNPLQMYLSDIFMCPVNLAGVPSLNIPCGFVNGLPVGMQIVGPQLSEELLFQIGFAYEQETNYYQIRPKL